MNVIIANKYRDALADLDIEVIKKLEGEFSVDEIVETFKNFFFQKMILDITALRDYQSISTLQKLSLSLDMDRLVLLLDGSPETSSPEFLSDLISMHIYNFTMNIEGVKWLYNHPNSYRDVAQYHQLDTNHNSTVVAPIMPDGGKSVSNHKTSVICLKNLTKEAGATTLAYIMMRQLSRNYSVVAIEVDKHDFMYFGDDKLYSCSNSELGNTIAKYSGMDIIIVDANNSNAAENLSSQVFYLLEPSKIKINKLLSKNANAFKNVKDKNVILNKCMLTNQDISDFEFESGLKFHYQLPALNDQNDSNPELDRFLSKIGFYKQDSGGSDSKKGLFGL